jgi:hypothetical protein
MKSLIIFFLLSASALAESKLLVIANSQPINMDYIKVEVPPYKVKAELIKPGTGVDMEEMVKESKDKVLLIKNRGSGYRFDFMTQDIKDVCKKTNTKYMLQIELPELRYKYYYLVLEVIRDSINIAKDDPNCIGIVLISPIVRLEEDEVEYRTFWLKVDEFYTLIEEKK